MNETKRTFPRLLAVSGAVLAIAGCGGGSSTTPAPTPVVNAMSGTAAVGSPIAGGTVKVICAAGAANASTTTTASGTWQTSVTGQTLPCAVQVSGGTIKGAANPTALHAFTTGFNTVNITPLTDLLVANLAASATPAIWFTALGTSPAPLQSISQAQADAALVKLRAALGALPPLATVNPVTTAFTAAAGNISDDILSSLQLALTNLSLSYASLLSNAATSAFTAPTGLAAAVGTAYSSTVSGTPAVAISPAPTNVQVAVVSQSQLTVSWAVASGAASYNVYRSTSPSVQVIAANKVASATPATSYQDSALAASTAYYYKVTAVNSAGESIGSAEVSGTTSTAAAVVATISSYSPKSGPVGSTVTIIGTNLGLGFQPAPTVKFGTTNAGTPYTFVGQTSLTVTVPSGLTAGDQTITIGGLSGTPMTVGTYTVTAAGGGTENGVTFTPQFASISTIPNSTPITGIFSEALGGGTKQTYSNGFGFAYRINLGVEEFNLSFIGTAVSSLNNGGFTTAPGSCAVSANTFGAPLCSSFGITFNKAAGTVSFVNTPMGTGLFGSAPTVFTVNGSLTFPPF